MPRAHQRVGAELISLWAQVKTGCTAWVLNGWPLHPLSLASDTNMMIEPINKQRIEAILVEAKRGWANVSDVEIESMATELLALREPKAWKHAGRPTPDETVATARRYLDNANREAARMAVGVVLMYEELDNLRKRCLCKGLSAD